jgi:hypothetical protein
MIPSQKEVQTGGGVNAYARCFLKSVAVRDRQLRVELGWGGHRDAAG